MDLVAGSTFTSDIDIIACLREFPPSEKWFYRTWEVKVSLLCKDGSARSLKRGKTDRTVTQLKAYREFGSPAVSLLDVYLCEAGFMRGNAFPPLVLNEPLSAKCAKLSEEGFGYQLLPFEHGKDGDADVGLLAMPSVLNLLQTTFNVLPALPGEPRQDFLALVQKLDQYFERADDRLGKHRHQIVYCKNCRDLQLIRMKDEDLCPTCQSDLVVQS